MSANVQVIPQTLIINSFSNSAQTLFSLTLPAENIVSVDNVISNSSNFTINVGGTLNNFNVSLLNISFTKNTTTNTYTHTLTPKSGGPTINITVPFINQSTARNLLGLNLNGMSYYNIEQPFLNLFKLAGSNFGAVGCWFTGNNTTFDTNEEAYLQLDANGYIMSMTANPIPANGQSFTKVFTFINNALNISAPRQTSAFPYGQYIFAFSGNGTMIISDPVLTDTMVSNSTYVTISGTTITSNLPPGISANVTMNVAQSAANSNGGFVLTITALPNATNYLQNFSWVQAQYQPLYDAGQIFHPMFLNMLQCGPIGYIRFKDWLNIDGQTLQSGTNSYIPYMNVAPTVGQNIIYGITNWGLPSGNNWRIGFTNGQEVIASCNVGSNVIHLTNASISSATFSSNAQVIQVPAKKDWFDRPIPSALSWSTVKGVPLETCINLCNTINVNGWINIPVNATDLYIQQMAQLIYNGNNSPISGFSGLNANLHAIIELSNENWNSTYAPNQYWGAYKGNVMFSPYGHVFPSDEFGIALNWYGSRLAFVGDTFASVFGNTFSQRITVSAGGQCANPFVAEQSLSAPYWVATGNTAPYPNHNVGSLHVGPYTGDELRQNTFIASVSTGSNVIVASTPTVNANILPGCFIYGNGLMSNTGTGPDIVVVSVSGNNITVNNTPTVTNATVTVVSDQYGILLSQSDGGYNYFFQLFTSNTFVGGTYSGTTIVSVPSGGWNNSAGALAGIVSHVNVAAVTYNSIPVHCYEMGGNFYDYNLTPNVNIGRVTSFLINTQRDPRMGNIYLQYFNTGKSLGACVMCMYSSVSPPGVYGSWGALETIMQPISPLSIAPPKWQGLMNFIASSNTPITSN